MNFVPARYRSISVATVPVPLDEASLRGFFLGRPAYRRTRYIVARAASPAAPAAAAAGGCAVVEVTRDSDAPLFSEITAVSLIAGPDETAFVEAPEVDTGVPSGLGRVAAERAAGCRCVVVHGRYGHVGFIVNPALVRIRVVEVVPPHPAKLADQASRVLDLAEDLPPVELVPELTDLGKLAAGRPAGHYLFPCRAGTAVADGPVSYLDEIPPRADWTLVGCARSRAIHDWFYQREAPVVDMCPRNLAVDGLRSGRLGREPVLTKCCLLEDRIAVEDGLVVVPWGASLAEIRDGLGRAVAAARPTAVAPAADAAPAPDAAARPTAPARAPDAAPAPAPASAPPPAPARAPDAAPAPASAPPPAPARAPDAAPAPAALTPAAVAGPIARPAGR